MRRHVGASFAGSTSRRGSGLGSIRRAFVPRDASGDVGGSGAPSARGRFTLLALAVAAFALLALAPLAQAKVVVNGFGLAGSLGGQFGNTLESGSGPGGVAVNNTGNGGVVKGTFYAVDAGQNRVERFSPTGLFERTWGQNVVGRDEQQKITLTNASGGSFILSFNGNPTAAIKVTANTSGVLTAPTASSIESALAAVSGIGSGNVKVSGATGGPFTVRFVGALGGTDVSQLTASAASLTGSSPSVTVTTLENGSGGNNSGFEICTEAAKCQDGLATATTANGGDLNNPQGIAVNQSNGHVYVADGGNHRIQEYDAEGNFLRAWGWDVESTTNEIQALTVKATGGKFTLTFGGKETAELTSTSTAAQVKAALEGLSSIGTGNVSVAGGPGDENGTKPYEVTFNGTLAGTNVAEVVATSGPGTPLSGGAATVTVATAQNGSGGSTGLETCTVAASCKTGVAGSGAGQFAATVNGASIGNLTVDSSNDVWVPDPVNNRIQEFSPTGSFMKMVGGDVITDGAEGTGTLSASSTTVSAVTTTSRFFEVGQTATSSGGHIPAGTTIVSCSPSCAAATSLTLSQKPTASGTETITAAPGAGNVPVNEKQTVTISNVAGGDFGLTFNGQQTGGVANGTFTKGSNTITGLSVRAGSNFVVGQLVNGGTIPKLPEGTTLTSCTPSCAAPTSVTISNPAPASESGQAALFEATEIPYNASAAVVQAKLEALSTVGSGNVSVSGSAGGPWVVTYQGKFAGADIPPVSVFGTEGYGLTPSSAPASASVISANPGSLEACSVATECRAVPAAAGTALGQFSEGGLGDVAFDSSGNLYAIDTGNKRVQELNPAFTTVTQFGASSLSAFTPIAPERMAATESGARLAFVVSAGENLFTGEREIVELSTSDGSVKDTSLAGLGVKPFNNSSVAFGGLAANTSTGTLYATAISSASPRRVLSLGTTAPSAPFAQMNEVTTKSSTTATFSGNVDPVGGMITCTFQYSTDQSNWTSVPIPACESLSQSGGTQAVSESITGLTPNTHYYVRLQVSRPLLANSTVTSGIRSFETEAVAPVITNVGSVEVEDTSARLAATVDPRNSATGYVIQYGTTPSLGSSTQAVNIGSGATPQVVSQVVTGLSRSTTYYFRFVATNLSGTTNSASATLTTRAEALPLPDHRAYELATPGIPFDSQEGAFDSSYSARWAVAPNGETIAICNVYPPEEVEDADAGCLDSVSHRGPEGWQSKALLQHQCTLDRTTGEEERVIRDWLSPNLNYAALLIPESSNCGVAPLSPSAPLPSMNLYRENLTSGSFDLLTPSPGFGTPTLSNQAAALPNNRGGFDASENLSRFFYLSTGQEATGAPSGNFAKLYEWNEGTVHLVSVKPTGANFTNAVTFPSFTPGSVSSNGERVFFGNAANILAPSQLYIREGGTATYQVSKPECSSPCKEGEAKLRWATPNGSKALFTTPAKLSSEDTSESGEDLYMWTASPNPESEPNLTVLSVDKEPVDGTEAGVRGVLGMSEDGNTVYFAANGQLVPGATTAPGAKIYRWRWNNGNPTLNFLANLEGTVATGLGGPQRSEGGNCASGYAQLPGEPFIDENNWSCTGPEGSGGTAERARLVTPDGKHLILDTTKRLDPVADTDSSRDVYTWDEEHGWRCVSCQQPGVTSKGASTVKATLGAAQLENSISNGLPIIVSSNNGERIFFTSRDELVSQDTNGSVRDVYEWHNGKVSLISSGTSTQNNLLIGASESGEDVFFQTAQQLVGWDTDIYRDVYDARVGGGFPEPPASGAPCEGEACRGAPSSVPSGTGAGTAAFEGSPNQSKPESKCKHGTVKRAGKCVKRHNHKKQKKQKRHPRRQRANHDRRAGR